MPFKSEKQRRYLWANEPEIARDWTDTYGSRIEKNEGGITDTKTVKGQPHLLAYITPNEVNKLKDLGGQETMTPEGIPAYPEWDNYGVSKSDFNKGDFTKSTDKTVRDLATGKTGVSATQLAATNRAEKKKEAIKEAKIKAKREKKAKKYREKVYKKRQELDRKIRYGLNLNKIKGSDFNLTAAIKEMSMNNPNMSYEEMVNEVISNAENYGLEKFQDYTPKTEAGKASLKKYPDQIREFYTPIKNPGGLTTGALTGGANVLGSMMMNKTPYSSELSRLAGQYGNLTSGEKFGLENIAAGGDIPTRDVFNKEFNPNTYAREHDLTWNPISRKFEPKSDGDGGDRPLWMRLGYGSESEWRNAGGGGGGAGGGTTPTEDEESEFQQSLTTNALTPNYYVGENPLASNIAWGKQAGVDPRTMGIYNQNQFGFPTWAAEGGRIGRAYGGIMDSSTGRRAYGIGSFFKSIGKAAKKIIKSPIGKIGIGALALGMPWGGAGTAGIGKGWFGSSSGFGKIAPWLLKGGGGKEGLKYGEVGTEAAKWNPWKIGILGAGALPFLMGDWGGDDDDDKGFDYEGAKNAYRDELMRIKAGAMAGTLDPNKFNYLGVKDGGRIGYYKGGQSIPSDYTLEDAEISTAQDKLSGITEAMKHADLYRSGDVGQFYAAQGGRIGFDYGSSYQKNYLINKGFGDQLINMSPKEITQLYDSVKGTWTDTKAQGGRIGYGAGGQTGRPPINLIKGNDQPVAQTPAPMSPNQNKPMNQPMNPMMARGNPMMNSPMMNRPMMNPMMARGNPMGGRRMAEEGGLMDLGGMEKDYRNDGGFVPLGGEEKADDVPARLSKNEFVFTADAVRGAGGGDIDKGAEIMENVMENLENGGNISEESQGLEGARDMFATSQRLEGVI
jgi:hypothetical protein